MITAMGNSKVKRMVQLNEKAKARREENIFIAEGIKMFLEAPQEKIRDIFVAESFLDKWGGAYEEKLKQYPYETVTDEVFRKISDTRTPQGILFTIERTESTLEEITAFPAPLLLLLEDIQDPGNLGTMIRTGEGAGIHGVIMSRETADLYNPKTIRATMGSIYRVPCLYVDNLGTAMGILRQKGIRTYAAHLEGTEYYNSCSFKEGTAFLIGNEGNGLRRETADKADSYIKIPMEGQVESLNAAIAASLFLYEAKRQRGCGGL